MLKIIGIVAVVASSVATGFIMAKDLNERTKSLKDIYQSAINIKSELEYRAPVLEECFRGRGRLFSKAWKYISENSLSPKEALRKACDEAVYLKRDDREIIYSYIENLFVEDIGGQISNISWLIDAMRLQIKEAEAEYTSKGRLYKSGGALAGIGLVILLL